MGDVIVKLDVVDLVCAGLLGMAFCAFLRDPKFRAAMLRKGQPDGRIEAPWLSAQGSTFVLLCALCLVGIVVPRNADFEYRQRLKNDAEKAHRSERRAQQATRAAADAVSELERAKQVFETANATHEGASPLMITALRPAVVDLSADPSPNRSIDFAVKLADKVVGEATVAAAAAPGSKPQPGAVITLSEGIPVSELSDLAVEARPTPSQGGAPRALNAWGSMEGRLSDGQWVTLSAADLDSPHSASLFAAPKDREF